jgi:dTDP-4-amino-4,6-dideoxygalactose transaminase
VVQTGATLVPVDVELHTANIDPDLVQSAVTSRTRAILAVHLFGQAADLKRLHEVATANNLFLIEDAAQAHGAQSTLGMVGSKSDAAAFSFYPTKNLGALGDAGGVTTDNEEIRDRIISRRSYGQASKYDHVDTGWNSRLDPLQAAILARRLPRLAAWNDLRSGIASKYLAALGDERGLRSIGAHSPMPSVWHHFVLRARDREDLQAYFRENQISTDAHYPYWIGELDPLKGMTRLESPTENFPNSIALAREVVSLPIAPWMTDENINKVADSLATLPAALLSQRV